MGSLAVRRNIDLCYIGRLTCCFYKGLPMVPYCSDRFGRRVTLAVGAVLMLGGVALQVTAPTVGQFIVARILGRRTSAGSTYYDTQRTLPQSARGSYLAQLQRRC